MPVRVEPPVGTVPAVSPLSAAERTELVVTRNRTASAYPSEQRIESLFEAQARAQPAAIAVIDGARQVSYSELNQRAERIASWLKANGVKRGNRVAIVLAPGWEFVASVLGTYKAGAAYVALDPKHPRLRLNLVWADARPVAAIVDAGSVELVPQQCATLLLDTLTRDDTSVDQTGHDGRSSRDLACVLYTSGSTGPPKGVMMPHRAVVNHSWWIAKTYGLGAAERVLQASPFSFDASMWEMTMPLITGGAIVVGSPLGRIDPPAFLSAIIEGQVTSLLLVPAQIPFLIDRPELAECTSLRNLFVGGEIFPAALARSLARRVSARIFNIYGPTETCVNSTMHEWTPTDDGSDVVPIGRPIGNTEVYVLDESGHVVPAATPGELYIGGHGVSDGYLNSPELTAERFVPSPFTTGTRLYRTGDRVRWNGGHGLEFLGRFDTQFKLRGIRIESGEVEAALTAHPAIGAAAVIVRGDTPESATLVAYLVTRQGTDRPSDAELRRFLRERLMEVMVPALYHWMEALPLNTHGKVDRTALPLVIDRAAAASETLNGTETRLRGLWARVLNRVSHLDDHFFDVGGNSLLAVQLFADIEDEFGVRLRISRLFEAPTIRQLARVIDLAVATAWTPLVAIRSTGTRQPLYVVHGIGGELLAFERLARHLSGDQPVYGFESPRWDASASGGIAETSKTYVDFLLRHQPCGPYLLAGYSAGGLIAFEMACQLQSAGHVVGRLVLIDPGLPPRVERRVGLDRAPLSSYVPHLIHWLRDDLLSSSLPRLWGRLRSRARIVGAALAKELHRGADPAPGMDVRDQLGLWHYPPAYRELLKRRWEAIETYEPSRFAGSVVIVRSRTLNLMRPQMAHTGWEAFVSAGVEQHMIVGSHDNILTEPRVRTVAAIITRALERTS